MKYEQVFPCLDLIIKMSSEGLTIFIQLLQTSNPLFT